MSLVKTLSFIANHPLNRSHQIQAFARFARWQLGTRILGRRPVVMPFVAGTSLVTEKGMTGATGNVYCGLHEHNEMGFVLHMLRPKDLFLDVGANVGSYTVLAAGAAGAHVISVEPLPATFARLQANLRYNDLSARVEAHCCGLSSQRGELKFVAARRDTTNRVALPDDALPTTTLPVLTMDEVCAGRVPRVIKIDVEGHEAAVLSGGTSTLRDKGVEAVLLETFGVSDQVLGDMMRDYGFIPCSYDSLARKLSLAGPRGDNTLFVRDLAQAQSHCQSAPSFSLINGTI